MTEVGYVFDLLNNEPLLGIESKAIARLVMAVIANRRETSIHRCAIQNEGQTFQDRDLFPMRKPREPIASTGVAVGDF